MVLGKQRYSFSALSHTRVRVVSPKGCFTVKTCNQQEVNAQGHVLNEHCKVTFNIGTVLVYTCFRPPDIQHKPLTVITEKKLGLAGSRLPATTASQGDACTLLLLGISPVLGLSENPHNFLKLNPFRCLWPSYDVSLD